MIDIGDWDEWWIFRQFWCLGRPAELLQLQHPPPPCFSSFSHLQLLSCSSPTRPTAGKWPRLSDCGEKPNSGLESHSSHIWCHPPTPKAKYGTNLPSALQAALGTCLKVRLGGPLITSDETGERENWREALWFKESLWGEVLEVLSPLC